MSAYFINIAFKESSQCTNIKKIFLMNGAFNKSTAKWKLSLSLCLLLNVSGVKSSIVHEIRKDNVILISLFGLLNRLPFSIF